MFSNSSLVGSTVVNVALTAVAGAQTTHNTSTIARASRTSPRTARCKVMPPMKCLISVISVVRRPHSLAEPKNKTMLTLIAPRLV